LVKVVKNTSVVDLRGLPNATYLLTLFDANDNKILAKRITKLEQ